MRRSTGFWSEQVFDAIPDALLLVDSTGEVLEANREAGNLFGAAPALLRGLPAQRLLGVAADRSTPSEASATTSVTPAARLDGTGFAAWVTSTAIQTSTREAFRVVTVRPLTYPNEALSHWVLNEMGVITTYAWLLRQRLDRAAESDPETWRAPLTDLDELEMAVARVTRSATQPTWTDPTPATQEDSDG